VESHACYGYALAGKTPPLCYQLFTSAPTAQRNPVAFAKPCKNLRHVAASVILVAATFLQKSPLALNAAAPSAQKVSLDSPARL
jgi:hypothetical protein